MYIVDLLIYLNLLGVLFHPCLSNMSVGDDISVAFSAAVQ